MGVDKAGLVWEGATLLDHMLKTVAEALERPVDRIHVSGERPGYRAIPDPLVGECRASPACRKKAGPIAGVLGSLNWFLNLPEEYRPGGVLFVPVDMPLLSVRMLKKLVEGYQQVRGQCASLSFQGFELPFVCQVDSKMSELCTQLLSGSNPSLASIRNFLLISEGLEMPLLSASEEQFYNVNHPEEWRRISR
jgi:molybdopterin-guanine dinucleotide biosynthesis protein A